MSNNKALIKDLKKTFTLDNILYSVEECYAYAQDASNSRTITNIPDAVVFVQNVEEIQQIVLCAKNIKHLLYAEGLGRMLLELVKLSTVELF